MKHDHIGPLSYGGSSKVTIVCLSVSLSVYLSLCLSVCQFSFFLRKGLVVFSVFFAWWYIIGILKNLKSPFYQKNSFLPKFEQKKPKIAPKIGFFFIFWKILSLVFPNNLKWKLIVFLIFHHQSHIWQSSGSQVLDQNTFSQSNCRIL